MKTAAIVFLVGIGAAGFAQGAPKDVPKDHWAYSAVDQMYRLGLLVGYPDGNFNGDRPASRYELAQSFSQLEKADEKLLGAFRDLRLNPSVKVDLGGLNERVRAMRAEVAALKKDGEELAALQEVMAKLNQNVATLRKASEELRRQMEALH